MVKKTIKLKPEITKRVKKYLIAVRAAGIPVERVYIFGSQAKGTARLDSDIDVAIVSPIFGKDVFDERLKLMHLRQKDYDIEPHPLHPNDLKKKWDVFVHEVKKWGIPV